MARRYVIGVGRLPRLVTLILSAPTSLSVTEVPSDRVDERVIPSFTATAQIDGKPSDKVYTDRGPHDRAPRAGEISLSHVEELVR